MALDAGSRIGFYDIVEQIGAGGMGEVYRARDRKLNRDVALKVLPASVGADADRVARFSREAQTLAALNHPNIAHVHGIEDDSTAGPCIVMELVPGRTLAEILAAGPLPITEALGIARQIADGLEAAHDAGLVHRDLKPANVKVRDDGTVKILDFGLAKAVDRAAPTVAADPMNSPTMASPATTQAGMILGTAAYMSPEQAKGRSVDKRADIWAFGAILFEMLTGEGAFHAEDISETLAAVLTRQIDLAKLPANTPPRLRALIRSCLVRDPKQRLRDIGDARIAINEILSGGGGAEQPQVVLTGPGPVWRRMAPWAVAAAAVIAAAAIGWRNANAPLVDTAAVVTRSATSLNVLSGFVALSPDGTQLAYTSAGPKGFHIALRPLDRLDAQPIAGTDDGRFPVFSPDGKSVAYTLGSGGVRRVSVSGGDVLEICDGDFSNGAAWTPDNTIIFSGKEGLLKVSANGGRAEQVTKLGTNEVAHIRPQVLPGGRLLFTIRKSGGGRPTFAVVDGNGYREITNGGDNGRFVASGLGRGIGHLTYGRDETLFAVPFDAERLTTAGVEVPVVERVSSVGPFWTADYAVSDRGLLVYSRAAQDSDRVLSWIDRAGKVEPLPAQTQMAIPRLSPDGSRAVGLILDETERPDIFVMDLKRGTTTRLSFRGSNRAAIWMPDGRRVVFGATHDKLHGIYVADADGGSQPRFAFATDLPASALALTPDGRTLLFSERGRIYIRDLDAGQDVKARPLHQSPPAREGNAQLSPDGRWVAYMSDESGRFEAYLHEFPGGSRRERVSTNGAQFVRWTSDGRELIYWNTGQTGNFSLSGVAVQTKPALQLGSPTVLLTLSDTQVIDVTADGSRAIAWIAKPGSTTTTFVTVTDWFEELRAKSPIAR